MSDLITLESVDVDGAIRESAEAAGMDRRSMLKRGAVAGGGFIAAGTLFSGLASPASAAISTRRPSAKNDGKIGNYALTLEYLEAAFYAEAVKNAAFQGPEQERFARVVANHEAKHVKGLKRLLGSAAVKEPKFDFGDTTTAAKFLATAVALEDTGVAAYAGQGPNIKSRTIVKAALSIHSVEARHAAWARYLLNPAGLVTKSADLPAPATYDKALSEKTVLSAVGKLDFIQ